MYLALVKFLEFYILSSFWSPHRVSECGANREQVFRFPQIIHQNGMNRSFAYSNWALVSPMNMLAVTCFGLHHTLAAIIVQAIKKRNNRKWCTNLCWLSGKMSCLQFKWCVGISKTTGAKTVNTSSIIYSHSFAFHLLSHLSFHPWVVLCPRVGTKLKYSLSGYMNVE